MPKYDYKLIDSLTSEDAVWPKDPAVPYMPPLTETIDQPAPKDNWLDVHYDDGLHPVTSPPPPPLTAVVSEEHPLKADAIFSMRSPYSYLVMSRLVYLNSNYSVDINIRMILPQAVRTRTESGAAGGPFARYYKLTDCMHDCFRTGQYEGIPFRWPQPDPIWQTIYPVKEGNWQWVHPPEKQPYIQWIVRLACYAQMHGKALHYINEVMTLIWGAHVDHWPDHVKESFNRIEGLDYDEAIKYIQEKPAKVDAIWEENSKVQMQAGHGGVPLMIFQGEPFFGQDRFDQFFSRLRQSGLTKRKEPRAPFTTKPLHWPTTD